MAEYALIEAGVVRNIIVVEDGATLPDRDGEVTADQFVRHLVNADSNPYEHWRSIDGLDPHPAIGWVLAGGKLTPAQTVVVDVDPIPADGKTAATITWSIRHPDGSADDVIDEVAVAVNGVPRSTVPVKNGRATVSVTSADVPEPHPADDPSLPRLIAVSIGDVGTAVSVAPPG